MEYPANMSSLYMVSNITLTGNSFCRDHTILLHLAAWINDGKRLTHSLHPFRR
jgi:hypothetical protein